MRKTTTRRSAGNEVSACSKDSASLDIFVFCITSPLLHHLSLPPPGMGGAAIAPPSSLVDRDGKPCDSLGESLLVFTSTGYISSNNSRNSVFWP